MWRRPILIIENDAGKNILPQLGGLWTEVKTVDAAGTKSDSAEITCIGPASIFGLPAQDAKFRIWMGWDDKPVLQGTYTYQKTALRGAPSEGHLITLTLRAADMGDKLKAQGHQSYENKTYGEIMEDIAKKAGLKANIDPDLAKIKIPYRLRWNQSLMDFAHELSTEVGAVFKPANGQLIASKRGGGKTATGKDLPIIKIRYSENCSYDAEVDARPNTGHVAASYIDPKSGKRKLVKEATGRDGPIFVLPHLARSEDEAKATAKAEAYDRGNNAMTGTFEVIAQPDAWAEAPVEISGFGWPIDGKSKAESVTKTVNASGGFTMSVEVKSGSEKKDKKE